MLPRLTPSPLALLLASCLASASLHAAPAAITTQGAPKLVVVLVVGWWAWQARAPDDVDRETEVPSRRIERHRAGLEPIAHAVPTVSPMSSAPSGAASGGFARLRGSRLRMVACLGACAPAVSFSSRPSANARAQVW